MHMAQGDPALFWVVMERAALTLFWIAMIAGAVGGTIYGCCRLYRMFYGRKKTDGGDMTESVLPDMLESLRARFRRSARGPSHPVRRMFYNKVRKYALKKNRANKILPGDTPWDIAEKIKASEDIDALTARYEQARYGSG
jgi:hypothetical protein